MKIVTGPRASGKTTELIRIANEDNHHLAVHTEARKSQIEDHYEDVENSIVTYAELFENGLRGELNKTVLIDDLDMFLQKAADGFGIEGFSITSTEVIDLND